MRIDLPEPELFYRMLLRKTGKQLETMPTGITLDSREAQPGDLFVAIRGDRVDGHKYLNSAREKGCAAAFVEEINSDCPLPQIQMDNPAITIAGLAQEWRSNFSVPALGITGSNGKTSTKDLLMHTLSASHVVHGTRGNYNTHLGLPLTLLELVSHYTLSILEMGANQRGDIGYLCNLSSPRYGLITNIAPAHLSGFGSIENISKTKGELFDALPSDGIAFVNFEDERIRDLTTGAQTVTYGYSAECDFTCDIHRDEDGVLSMIINGHEIFLNSYNQTFAHNVIAACAVSITFDVSWEDFAQSVISFEPTKGRCIIKEFDGVTVIDDTYNANLTSTLAALDLLLAHPSRGKRIVVFADMLELGDDSEEYHRRVGKACVENGIEQLFCLGEESRITVTLAQAAIDARHFDDKRGLTDCIKEEISEGDIILFKGSRGMELETVIEEVFKD
jgi:UDP-N-acetylmuramoyl-tripeptide--D-alanyl-D-alanine ligase|tara:strand:+ start:4184 stop:5527 length:1344 start_codon:yes stop_codon:yes gene_type:complete